MPFSSPNYQPLKPDFILINAQLYNVVKLSINNVHYYKSSQINNLYDGKEKKIKKRWKMDKERKL